MSEFPPEASVVDREKSVSV